MLNYSLPCSCSENLSSFWFIIKQQWIIEEIYIFSNSSHLEWRVGLSDTIVKGSTQGPSLPGLVNLVQRFQRRRFKCESWRCTTDGRRRTPSDGKSSHGFWPGELKKGCTPLAAASDKAYQLLAHGRWFPPGTPASSTTIELKYCWK
jgi:hypothetical protein